MFKQLSKLKLSNLRFYFQELEFIRGAYLWRQGDLVNGIFCIISGEARLVKEAWTMTANPAKAKGAESTDELMRHQTLDLINELKRKTS